MSERIAEQNSNGRYVLVKEDSVYNIWCYCPCCEGNFVGSKIIRIGSFDEIYNQKIILNRLYGKK